MLDIKQFFCYNAVMDMREIISKNLIAYRKQAGLTQQELADQLNYSDKAVSKWERGESIPDVLILKHIADCYGITLNDILSEEAEKPSLFHNFPIRRRNIIHTLIALLSAGLVFLLATIAVVVCGMLNIKIGVMIYVISLPVSIIVLLVFACIWGSIYLRGAIVSMLVWACCICFDMLMPITNSWLIYLLGGAMQILVVLWFFLLYYLGKRSSIPRKKKSK